MKKRDISKLAIAMFSLSGLLFIYAIWAFIQCQSYITDAVAAGQLSVGGNEYDIVSFYMTNSLTYIMTAVLLFALGWLIQKLPAAVRENPVKPSKGDNRSKDNDELDEWFEEMRQDEDE